MSSSSLSLTSQGTQSFTSVLAFLNTLDQSHLGIETRLKSTHVFPMLVLLMIVAALLIITRLVREDTSWHWLRWLALVGPCSCVIATCVGSSGRRSSSSCRRCFQCCNG